jgi:ankyrin repeat protein
LDLFNSLIDFSDGPAVVAAIASGDLDPTSELGGRLLHEACRWDRLDVVAALLGAGAPVDARGQNGATPLALAVRYRHRPLIDLLLAHGADVAAVDRHGQSVLAAAASAVDGDPVSIVPLLLARAAPVNVRDGLGTTELHHAARRGDASVVAALIDHGAEPIIENHDGQTAVEWALEWGRVDAARRLLDWCRQHGFTELMADRLVVAAARGNCVELVGDLLGTARLEAAGVAGWTALQHAAHYGHVDAMRALMAAGATPDGREPRVLTPMALATRGGHLEAVRCLLDAGATPDLQSGNPTERPIDIAIEAGLPEIAALLQARDQTPPSAVADAQLVRAARSGDARDLESAFRAAVPPSEPARRRAFVIALERDAIAIALAIAESGIDPTGATPDGTPILAHATRARSADPALIRALLSRGADPNSVGPNRLPPLHAVAGRGGVVDHDFDRPVVYGDEARRGLEAAAAALLAHGADPNGTDGDGRTPLMAAARGGTVAMLRLLLDAGARLRDVDRAGRDALMHAASTRDDRLAVVRELLRRGADRSRRDRQGRSALDLADPSGEVAAALRGPTP